MTIRQTKQLPLRELFERARSIRYAVISPWDKLPADPPEELIVLTDQLENLKVIWNMTIRSKERAVYCVSLASGDLINIIVLEKGKHVFPEQFESRLLNHRVMHEGCVPVPDSNSWPLARLYWKLFYQNWMADEPEDRKWMINYVKHQIGGEPLRPKYRWLELNTKTVSSPHLATAASNPARHHPLPQETAN